MTTMSDRPIFFDVAASHDTKARMTITVRHLLFGLLVLGVASPGTAQTPPARRAGLWEVRQGPAGAADLPAIKICLDAAQANGDIGSEKAARDKSCNYQRLSASATEVTWRNVCKHEGDTTTMEGRAYDIKPESFKADMKMGGSMGQGMVHSQWRWLSANCGTAK